MPIEPTTSSDRPQPRPADFVEVKTNGTGAATTPPPPQRGPPPITVTINLKWKKVMTHEGEKDHLVFREPTVRDMIDYGVPVNIVFSEGKAVTTFDPPAMTQMLASLAIVTPSVIESMDPRDWISAAWGVSRFFVPDFRTVS